MSLVVEQYTLLKDEFISVLSRHKVQKSKLNKKNVPWATLKFVLFSLFVNNVSKSLYQLRIGEKN